MPVPLVSVRGKLPRTDVYAPSRFDYIFGTKSTFSQWPSFHREKPLIHLEGVDHVVKLEDFCVCYLEWES
jgi:hypothetical protein